MLYSSVPEYVVVPPEGTVGTEASADIDITLNDGLEGQFLEAIIFHT